MTYRIRVNTVIKAHVSYYSYYCRKIKLPLTIATAALYCNELLDDSKRGVRFNPPTVRVVGQITFWYYWSPTVSSALGIEETGHSFA